MAGSLSILTTITISALGPSAMVPPLPGAPGQPPVSLELAPDGHLVVALAAAAVVLGTVGLVAGLRSVARMPSARWLVLAGCVAAGVLVFLPPSGSADHLNYAAYGRIQILGYDPYVTVPADLPGDPVAGAVEEWRTTPSVYGPVATAVQALASRVGGPSVRLAVFVLSLVNAAAFVAVGLLLHRQTRHDPLRQRRAALLWTANPLVIYQLVAGMHLDTLAIAFVLAGLVARRGALLGLGIAVKATTGLVALGTAWELRRHPRRLVLVAGAATGTVLVVYWLAGPHSLDQIANASRYVSLASPWKLAQQAAQQGLGPGSYKVWVQLGSLVLLAGLAMLLVRAADRQAALREVVDRPGVSGATVALACVVAWLFATPYVLPWYDALAFALLALVPWAGLEGVLVAHLTVLSLAYLPARQHDQPADLGWLVSVVRQQVAPWVLLALTVGLLYHAGRTAADRTAVRAGVRARTRPG